MDLIKVIFHVSQKEDFEVAYRNINNMLKSEHNLYISVLLNGEAIEEILNEQLVNDLILNEVEVVACANSLSNADINKNQLNSEVVVVEAGVVELALRQADGFAYIKP